MEERVKCTPTSGKYFRTQHCIVSLYRSVSRSEETPSGSSSAACGDMIVGLRGMGKQRRRKGSVQAKRILDLARFRSSKDRAGKGCRAVGSYVTVQFSLALSYMPVRVYRWTSLCGRLILSLGIKGLFDRAENPLQHLIQRIRTCTTIRQ